MNDGAGSLPKPMRLAYCNIIADDIEALAQFYSVVFGMAEIVAHRSPIYRCLDAGGVELGFNARAAYALLGLADRKASTAGLSRAPVRAYFTFEVGSREAVDATCRAVAAYGGRIVKDPYETYYNAWQAVLEDPEGNVFRANYRIGPRIPYAN
jgi:predicted enzyme related to lactoylglutathione lyase